MINPELINMYELLNGSKSNPFLAASIMSGD